MALAAELTAEAVVALLEPSQAPHSALGQRVARDTGDSQEWDHVVEAVDEKAHCLGVAGLRLYL